MGSHMRPALVLLACFTLLTGLFYPLTMTGLASVLFPRQATGSLLTSNGQIIGSELIGQRFADDRYFHGRPSAAGKDGYDASSSSGSNLAPLSKALIERVSADVAKLHEASIAAIPADGVTTSASGLDPHISPAYAEMQISRVAKARSVDPERVRLIVRKLTEPPAIGFLGEPRINVLDLNLALDAAIALGMG